MDYKIDISTYQIWQLFWITKQLTFLEVVIHNYGDKKTQFPSHSARNKTLLDNRMEFFCSWYTQFVEAKDVSKFRFLHKNTKCRWVIFLCFKSARKSSIFKTKVSKLGFLGFVKAPVGVLGHFQPKLIVTNIIVCMWKQRKTVFGTSFTVLTVHRSFVSKFFFGDRC